MQARIAKLEVRQGSPEDAWRNQLTDQELFELVVIMGSWVAEQPGFSDEIRAEVERDLAERKAEVENWQQYWDRPDTAEILPSDWSPPLIGNGIGRERDEEKIQNRGWSITEIIEARWPELLPYAEKGVHELLAEV
jgi:hypothetical protein